MYRDAYQRGLLSIFFSGGAKPLETWDTFIQSGYINRFLDQDIKSMVLDLCGSNISTTYMVCPKGNQVLGIHMPFMIMIVKNLMKYFSFEVTILDDTGTRRRFRVSNFQSKTQILPLCTVMPIGLTDGWNQIQFNLAEFTRRAYNKQYVEVHKVKINANIRLRRIYFAERLLQDDELPREYKLYFPLSAKPDRTKKLKEELIRSIKADTGSKLNARKSNLSTHVMPEISTTAEQGKEPQVLDETLPADAKTDEEVVVIKEPIEGEEPTEGEEHIEKHSVEEQIGPEEGQGGEEPVSGEDPNLIEKAPSTLKTASIEKAEGAVKVASAEKAGSAEKVASVMKAASGEKVASDEKVASSNKVASGEKVASGDKVVSTEKVASVQKAPSEAAVEQEDLMMRFE